MHARRRMPGDILEPPRSASTGGETIGSLSIVSGVAPGSGSRLSAVEPSTRHEGYEGSAAAIVRCRLSAVGPKPETR